MAWSCLNSSYTYNVYKVFPEAELHIVPDAGHSSREPGIAKLLVEAGFFRIDNILWSDQCFMPRLPINSLIYKGKDIISSGQVFFDGYI